MDSRQQVVQRSRRYRHLLMVILVLLPCIQAFAWIFIEEIPMHWAYHQNFSVVHGFTPVMKILGFLVSMIKTGIVMYGLWVLIRLFSFYEQGRFFHNENVTCFASLSKVLISWVVAGLFATPLLSIILTMNNPQGQHSLQISFASADLTALIVGGILAVIARVMEDGRRLQEEADLTV